MCGRYTHLYTWRELYRLLNLNTATPELEVHPSWNVAPTQTAPVIAPNEHGEPTGQLMRWGFTPTWAKDLPTQPINARAETVATSPMFRESFKTHRCIVPVSGFYEWKKGATERSPKQPYYITLKDQPIMLLAGLWTHGAGDAPATFTILTTTPNALMAEVHNRMPVVVPLGRHADWIGTGTVAWNDLAEISAPFPAEQMQMVMVGTKINSPRNNDPSLVAARTITDEPDAGTLFS